MFIGVDLTWWRVMVVMVPGTGMPAFFHLSI
jgi:hypothetical protein